MFDLLAPLTHPLDTQLFIQTTLYLTIGLLMGLGVLFIAMIIQDLLNFKYANNIQLTNVTESQYRHINKLEGYYY